MIGSRAWWALMRRNLIYRKRNWMGTFLELALPVAFMAILVAIKNSVKDSEGFQAETINATFPEIAYKPFSFRDYVTAMQATHKCVEGINPETGALDFSITGVPLQGANWTVPFVKCDSRRCTRNGEDATEFCEIGIIAVSGSNATDVGGQSRSVDFTTWLYDQYPELSTNMPFTYPIVKVFNTSQDMTDYVKDKNYGQPTIPKIVMGIVFEGNSLLDYKYTLRQNSTNFNSPESEWRPAVTTTPDTGRLFKDYAKDDWDVCISQDGEAQQGWLQESCTGRYLYNGVLTFQRLVGDFIMSDSGAVENGYNVAESSVSFSPFPTFAYVESGFFGDIGEMLALLVVLGLLYPVAAMISYITREKEQGQKELMKMMSAAESDIGWSWFVSFLSFNIVTATIVSAVSMALFVKSEGLLLWMFWVFFYLALTVFCMFLATLTSKTTRAVVVGLLIFFVGVFVSFAVDVEDGSSALIGLISLHPVGALSYGLQVIGTLEDQDIGLQGNTLGSSDTSSGWTVENSLQYFLIDTLIYGFLTWYLNRTVKPDNGQSLPFWFPFTRAYWLPRSVHHHAGDSDLREEEIHSSVPFEVVDRRSGEEGDDIVIRNLRMTFGKKHAVDGLSLTMYNGHVTALLGHNGAGKTTTIKLLTGALSPTSGSATIAGKSIRGDMGEIRENIGLCPQENCLFDVLTVRETVQFFARLKGVYSKMSVEEANAHVDQSIQDIALAEKCNTLAKNLSGGMKRKLSVAIAFCGGSKTVILDEPTSGMDPFSRRFTWDVIRQYRENRTIILTTHFMDEADILGDRIAIMAEGQLRCVGSALFLKKTYGVGYQLTIEKEKFSENGREVEVDVDEAQSDTAADHHQTDAMLREIVKSAVPEAIRLSNSSTEMRYQLPIASSSSFVPMLNALDEAANRGEISSYGVSITTLDEVFLAVAQGDTREKNEFASSAMNIDSHTVHSNSDEDKSSHSTHSAMNLEKEGLFARHVGALLRKRAANFKRDKKAWLCTTILPSLFVLLGFIIAVYAGVEKNLDPILLTLDDYNIHVDPVLRNPIVYNSPGAYSCQPEMCAYPIPIMNSTTNPGTDELYHFCGEQARLNKTEQCSISQSTDIIEGINDAGAFSVETNVASLEESSRSLYASWNSFASSQYGAIFFTHDTQSATTGLEFYNNAVYNACLDNLDNYTTVEQCLRFGGIGYVIQYNYTALHVAPLLQVLADEAITREALNNPTFNIECTLDPLPVTLTEENYGKAEDTFLAWFLIVVSFPFIAGAFGTFVVSERQSKAKHLQTVAGIEPHAYWLSTWLWDVANYQIPCWITVALMFAFDVEALATTTRGVVGGVITLLVLFGPAAASFTYCVSFAFESPAMCNLFVIISGFLIGMGGPIAIWILHIIGEGGDRNDPNEKLLDAANIVAWVLRFFPTFCLSNGIYNAIYIQAWEYWEGKQLTVWSDSILLVEVIFLAVEAVVYLALAVLLDKWSTNPRMRSIGRKIKQFLTCQCFCHQESRLDDITVALPDDDDVLTEQTRVLEGEANNDLIVLSEITKIYDTGKKAVSSFSIGIASGECFGLLGINGAGKTTTLQILTAEFPPTSGDATLAGFSVTKEPEKTRRRIGYCPQFDAHFENMTGREHVELYASIKGVPKDCVKSSAAACLAEVGLSPDDCDRLSSHYSGGMKRRLSLACALIGQPQIVFLDECTTGVDPVARREIWQVISNMVTQVHNDKKPAVILTTHSMEECEALCPRIGIMANGRLRCLGSAQHLKNRFGKGFQVELKVDVIGRMDTDYVNNLRALAACKGITEDEEAPDDADTVYFSLTEVQEALQALTNDSFLTDMVSAENPVGFGIWRDATSVTGCSLEELTAFCTCELRLRLVEEFMKTNYPGFVLRERQDSKVRYEVPSENVRISSIFASIEDNKARLRLSDYGVSQTSLEQVFNMHAAEAERLKQGRIDG